MLSVSPLEVAAELLVRSTLLLAITACVCLLIRGSSASIRHLVWFGGLSGALLLPALAGILPAVRVPVPAPVAAITSTVTRSSQVESGTRVFEAPEAPGAADAPGIPVEAANPLAGLGAPLLLLWAAGTLVLLLRLLVGATQVRRLRRAAGFVEDETWLHLSSDLAATLDVRREVTLLMGSGSNVPMTWGVLRPVIWLPLAAREWTPEQLRDVLAHELAHIRRRDALTGWIGRIAAAVHWVNPLVWVAVRRLQEESEHACDDAVLSLGSPSVSYAEHLLKVVRSAERQPSPVPAMAMARGSGIEQRIRAILDPSVRRYPAARERGAGVLFAAGVVLLPLASLHPIAVTPARMSAGTAVTSVLPVTTAANRASDPKVDSPVREAVDDLEEPESTPLPFAAALDTGGADSSRSGLPSSVTSEVSEPEERYAAVVEESGGSGEGSTTGADSSSSSSSSSTSSSSSSSSNSNSRGSSSRSGSASSESSSSSSP